MKKTLVSTVDGTMRRLWVSVAILLGCTAPPPAKIHEAEVAKLRPPWRVAVASGVTVSEVQAAWMPSPRPLHHGRNVLRVDANVRFFAMPKVRSSVWIKASCQRGSHVFVAADEAEDDDWLLYEIKGDQIGESIPIHQELFAAEDWSSTSPCQLEFRVVPLELGPMQRIEPRFCVDGEHVEPAECARPRTTEDDPRYAVSEWELGDETIAFAVTAGERISRHAAVGLRTECDDWMTMRTSDLAWQWLDPGESYAVRLGQRVAGTCSLTVERWREDPQTREVGERVELGHACVKAGTLHDGRCVSLAAQPVARPGPGPALTATLDTADVAIGRGSAKIRLTVDLEAIRPIQDWDRDRDALSGGLSSELWCRRSGRVMEWSDVSQRFDLRHLRIGDRIPAELTATVNSASVDCELTLTDDVVELGRWCIEGERVEPCTAGLEPPAEEQATARP